MQSKIKVLIIQSNSCNNKTSSPLAKGNINMVLEVGGKLVIFKLLETSYRGKV
jgi:hypothetical protein